MNAEAARVEADAYAQKNEILAQSAEAAPAGAIAAEGQIETSIAAAEEVKNALETEKPVLTVNANNDPALQVVDSTIAKIEDANPTLHI
jgi:hypothetical protein